MRTKIGDVAIQVMHEYEIARLCWGDAYTLHDIYNLAGCKGKLRVPTDAWQHVLNALDRDERFQKQYFRGHVGMRLDVFIPRRLRMFVIAAGVS